MALALVAARGLCSVAWTTPNPHRRALPARIMAQAGGAAAAAPAEPAAPPARHGTGVSQRVQSTQPPCVVATKKLMAQKGAEGTLSLAQGIVHWQPPAAALQRAAELVASGDPALSQYGPDEGLPELRQALREKLERENGLTGYDVMVTTGANQAFSNVVLALLDPSDRVALYKPFYFNHLMAVQMSGGGDNVAFGPRKPGSGHPDLDWLAAELAGPNPPRLVVLTNPCNPTGTLMKPEEVERAAALCADAGAWLVLDNTYEHFVFGEGRHHCAAGPHVIHIFSFSKAYGMMGWRQGYIAYPEDGSGSLAAQLLKVQDTIPVCPTQISQHVALEAVRQGRQWVTDQVKGLVGNREALVDALSPLGAENVVGGEGAIYLFAKLPEGCEDDNAVVQWLVMKHKVCIIPGSSCGRPGHVRAAFANLKPDLCAEAAARLKAGLTELVRDGMPAVRKYLEEQGAAPWP